MALENDFDFANMFHIGKRSFFIDDGSFSYLTYSKEDSLRKFDNKDVGIRCIESMAVINPDSKVQSDLLVFILKGTGSTFDLNDNRTRYSICKFSDESMECVLSGIDDIGLVPNSDYIAAHITKNGRDLALLINKYGNCLPYISINGCYYRADQFGIDEAKKIIHSEEAEEKSIEETLKGLNNNQTGYISKNGHYYKADQFGADEELRIMQDKETKRRTIEETLKGLNYNKCSISSSANEISNKIFGLLVAPSARVIAVSSVEPVVVKDKAMLDNPSARESTVSSDEPVAVKDKTLLENPSARVSIVSNVPPAVEKKGFFRSINLSNLHGEVNYNPSVKKAFEKKKGFFRSINLSNLHGGAPVKKLSFTSSRLKTISQKGEKPLE